MLEHRHQHKGRQTGGETAVVQVEAAVNGGHAGDQAIVQYTRNHARDEAIVTRDGRKTAGKAQADHDALRVDRAHAKQRTDEVAHHNGQHVQRRRAGSAEGEHTPDHAEGRAGELRADQIVIRHDEQAVHAEIDRAGADAVLAREIHLVAGIEQQLAVAPEAAVEDQAKDQAQCKAGDREAIAEQRVALAQCRLDGRRLHAERLIHDGEDRKTQKARRRTRIVQVVALVEELRVGAERGHRHAHHHADQ